jgi:hypothetical protein
VAIDADYEDALADLLKLSFHLRQDGVESALEHSHRGGHLWIFMTEPLPARDCRIYVCGVALCQGISSRPTPSGGCGWPLCGLHRASGSKKVPAGIVLGDARKKGTVWAVPFEHLAVVMATCGAIVKPGPQAALPETCGPSRMGKGHFCRASRTALCPHARRGNPRLTLVSDGNPLRRLLLGS